MACCSLYSQSGLCVNIQCKTWTNLTSRVIVYLKHLQYTVHQLIHLAQNDNIRDKGSTLNTENTNTSM